MLKKEGLNSAKRRGLGRGLNALFEDEESYPAVSDSHAEGTSAAVQNDSAPQSGPRRSVGIDQLEAGPWQPRQQFEPQALQELAESIRQHGIVQPLVVRARPDAEHRYQIIAGERRWRAAQIAQLHEVPVVIKEISEEQAMEIALIENLQRADLNAVEEALGYARLMKEFSYTQEKLAQGLGKSRSHVANMVRLLTLPVGVQALVRHGQLSAGHARALVTAKDAEELARQIVAQGLSVRETEKLAAQGGGKGGKKRAGHRPEKDVDTVALEKEMSDKLGLRVTIDVKSNGKGARWGSLKVDFKNLDQLDEVLQRLSHEARRDIIGA